VPEALRAEVKKRIAKELEAGITPRSTDELDFTTFGELGEIIKTNWVVFGGMLNNAKAVEKILASLNTLRNPIAHCSELAPDEAVRLRLGMRDWFRQMEKA